MRHLNRIFLGLALVLSTLSFSKLFGRDVGGFVTVMQTSDSQ